MNNEKNKKGMGMDNGINVGAEKSMGIQMETNMGMGLGASVTPAPTPEIGAGMAPPTGPSVSYMPSPVMYQPYGMCCPFLMSMQCPMLYGQYGQGTMWTGYMNYPYMANPYMGSMYPPMTGTQY